ncbi:unnamed protein product [Euphydryas editha]|uniref:Peptidase M14 domain-containing protein n=1 Tax=Euphydryas editha TaxID=104508 RepID=A0AAU9ULY9_EUPED|nr:unnamed protein product [Euphydryas editha]
MLMPLLSLGNYTPYKITAYNMHERNFLYQLHVKNPKVIFINGVTNEAAIPMDVIVRTDTVQMFEEKLHSFDIQFMHVPQISIEPTLSKKIISPDYLSIEFYDWENILSWINSYAKKSSTFKKTVIAKTFEKRDIFILNLSKGKKKPIVFIVGGEDGKDWMSSALILSLFTKLLDRKNSLNTLLTKFDFYLLPILNPDGFAFSKKQDRLWSKNRKVFSTQKKCQEGNVAVGVDIARNWFLQKSSRMIEECNSVYIGHRSLSEEESQALSYVLNSLALDMIAFINIKGFGQYITIPYGHNDDITNNHDIVMEIVRSTCSKILEKHNITYYYDNFSGNMADWVKLKLNTPIVYTVYLEDADTILPYSAQIQNLKTRLFTILTESLLLSQDIYGPLFNSQENMFLCYIKNIYIVFIYMYYKLL